MRVRAKTLKANTMDTGGRSHDAASTLPARLRMMSCGEAHFNAAVMTITVIEPADTERQPQRYRY